MDKDIDIRWSGPRKCSWQDCSSKATFHSPSSLKAHIRNIHVSPLLCIHPGCSYKKPFGKPCDLRRHVATVHNTERGYQCLQSDCQEVFSRRDKMMKHAREKHELFKCIYNHCSATVFAAQRESHTQKSHGRYECAIASCELASRSCFTEENLDRHLRTCHRMSYDAVHSVRYRPVQTTEGDKVLYADASLRCTYQDCANCLPKSRNE